MTNSSNMTRVCDNASAVQWPTGKAVYSRCYRTLVGEEPRDPTLVLCSCSADERRVENEAILWRITPRLQRPSLQ